MSTILSSLVCQYYHRSAFRDGKTAKVSILMKRFVYSTRLCFEPLWLACLKCFWDFTEKKRIHIILETFSFQPQLWNLNLITWRTQQNNAHFLLRRITARTGTFTLPHIPLSLNAKQSARFTVFRFILFRFGFPRISFETQQKKFFCFSLIIYNRFLCNESWWRWLFELADGCVVVEGSAMRSQLPWNLIFHQGEWHA